MIQLPFSYTQKYDNMIRGSSDEMVSGICRTSLRDY